MSAQNIINDHGIITVDTNFVRPQYNASHLIVQNGEAAFIDVGTSNKVNILENSLRENNLDKADVKYIFLTHIHLDHAGGAGQLIKLLPNAKLVVHPKGVEHMINPSKLIESSVRVYGKNLFDHLFGEIIPIDEKRIFVPSDKDEIYLSDRRFELFFTEGHAKHHYCIFDEISNSVFSGDNFGMSFREFDSINGKISIPITSPNQFDPDKAHNSIDSIIGYKPKYIYLAHFGQLDEIEKIGTVLHQFIDEFVDIAEKNVNEKNTLESIHSSLQEHIKNKLFEHGCSNIEEKLNNFIQTDLYVNAAGLNYWISKNHSNQRIK